jgi:NAD(P)-dependent dehydrogenase (short-subunit alcohol dehydrogenase family)
MSDIDLKGRAVVVTGGSQGLGQSMAEALAAAGARVAIASPDTDRLESVADKIGCDRCLPITADITDEDDCRRIVAETTKAFGGVEVLVNNARRVPTDDKALFYKARPEFWRESVLVNVYGTFLISRHAAPAMVERGWGRIVNVSTGVNGMQERYRSPYGVTKAAVDSETLIWAQDLEGTGVTCNVILPGAAVETGVRMRPPARTQNLLEVDVMNSIMVWLASDLSDGVTGKRYVGMTWDPALPPNKAAKQCLEDSPIRFDPSSL